MKVCRARKIPVKIYVTINDGKITHYQILAIFIKAAVKADTTGELAKYEENADNCLNRQDYSPSDIEKAYKHCFNEITKQRVGKKANEYLIAMLNDMSVDFEMSNEKAANEQT